MHFVSQKINFSERKAVIKTEEDFNKTQDADEVNLTDRKTRNQFKEDAS
jgi:hypothetical protein